MVFSVFHRFSYTNTMAVAGVVCRSRFLLRKDYITGYRYSTLLISLPNDNCVSIRHSFRHLSEIRVCASKHHVHGKTVSEVCKTAESSGGRKSSTSSSSSSSSSDNDATDLDEDGFRRPRVNRLQPLGQNNIYYQYSEVTIEYVRGLPHITVPLPSRKERCRFIVRPLSNTVGDLLSMLRREDGGIDRAIACTMDGTRIASSNTVESLLESDFRLVINENVYKVKPPKCERISGEEVQRLNDVRNIVSQLYEALNVQEHQVQKERDLTTQLETLRQELLPIEEKRMEVEMVALRRTDYMAWVGLGLMSVQFGILARLTWWEYSWDIMEPVTYFVTYGTAMAAYAYYVVTKQEYILNDVRDRQHLLAIHKKAKKLGIDLVKYNQLKDQIRSLELDLRKLKDPLRLQIPAQLATAAAAEPKPISWAPSIDDATGGTGNTTDLKPTTDAKPNK